MKRPWTNWGGWWLVIFILCLPTASLGQEAQPKKVDWLRGEGESLAIRLKGQIVSADGKPASDAKLTLSVTDGQGRSNELEPPREGATFEYWVPVGKVYWYSIVLSAVSSDGKQSCSRVISRDELRQAAIDGLSLELRPFDRVIEIHVVDKERPVPGAQVRVDSSARFEQPGVTDEKGIARFGLFKEDTLFEITAWTKDRRIGGYQFYRQPTRDMKADKHTIELSACRPQKIRFVNDADNTPVAGVGFTFWVATPTPFYNYVGLIPESTMKTDDKGEAVFEYFPDWPAHHFYADRIDKEWIRQGDTKGEVNAEGVFEVRVKKSQRSARKQITGQVSSFDGNPAGFCVEIYSSESQDRFRPEQRYAITDAQGRFSVDVYPGTTYCFYVIDARCVSNMIDLIPYEPETQKLTSPLLEVVQGNPIEVLVTSGPDKTPIVAASVGLQSSHQFNWTEKGEVQRGGASRFWFAKTGEDGIARTYAEPGKKISLSFHQPDWDVDKSVVVSDKPGEVTKVTLHREVAKRQRIVGKLSLADDVVASLEGAKVLMSALDKKSRDQNIVSVDAEGKFAFDTSATKFGLFAYTADDNAAASATIHVTGEDSEVVLELKQTGEYRGRLIDQNGAPLIFHTVDASLQITSIPEMPNPPRGYQPQTFTGRTLKVRTDLDGNYTIKGVPFGVALHQQTSATNDSRNERYFADVFLKAGETPPVDVSDIHVPLADRWETSKRDARLGGFHVMVVTHHEGAASRDFVAECLHDYDELPEVGGYVPISHQASGEGVRKAELEFAKSMNWPVPDAGKVNAIALDGAGKELGRVELAIEDASAKEKAAKFVREFAPAKMDARKKWDEAFAVAKKSGRRVWVCAGEPFNPSCRMLARWLDRFGPVVEKDYVVVHIDVARDAGGEEIGKRLWGDSETVGLPFQAIFEAEGKRLIDSKAALGNIGYPNGAAGVAQLKKMLLETRAKLTDEEVEKLVRSLPD